ncbi:hypothetical protein ACMFMG_006412 [Clarireedia jacksonii]
MGSTLESPQPNEKQECKVIFHFIRHAEAYHNVTAIVNRWHIADPPLTPKGIKQCAKLKEALPKDLNVSLILCSPMMRTMQTALHVFDEVLKDEAVRLLAVPDLREWGGGSSGTGLPYDNIKSNPALSRVDLEMVPDNWHVNQEQFGDKNRATVLRNDLFELAKQIQRGENSVWPTCGRISALFEWSSNNIQSPYEIAVVSHAKFLEAVLDVPCECVFAGDGFFNGNMRSYEFCSSVDENGKESYKFLQTIDSVKDPVGRSAICVNADNAADANLRMVDGIPGFITLHSKLKRQTAETRAGTLDKLFIEARRFLTKTRMKEQSAEGLKSQIWQFERRVDGLFLEDEEKVKQTERNYWMGMQRRNPIMYEYIGPEAVEFNRPLHPWLAQVANEEQEQEQDVEAGWEGKVKKWMEEEDHLMEGSTEVGSKNEETAILGWGISVRNENEERVGTSLRQLNGDKIGKSVEDKNLKRKASENCDRMDIVEDCIVDVVEIENEYAQ